MNSDEEKPLQATLDHLDDAFEDSDTTDLISIIEAFGKRAFGPILILAGLILLTPLGAIPGVPIALGIIVISFSIQLLLGRDTPWMPKILARVKMRRKDVKKTKEKATPTLAKIDGLLRQRFIWTSRPTFAKLTAILSIIFAITLIPLGAVPFAVVIPGFMICLLGLGTAARDGLILLVAYVVSFAALSGIAILIFR